LIRGLEQARFDAAGFFLQAVQDFADGVASDLDDVGALGVAS